LRALRATVDEGFRASKSSFEAIEMKLREEENAKRRKERRNMTVLTAWACTMWIVMWVTLVSLVMS
jgi:hypothetical protein